MDSSKESPYKEDPRFLTFEGQMFYTSLIWIIGQENKEKGLQIDAESIYQRIEEIIADPVLLNEYANKVSRPSYQDDIEPESEQESYEYSDLDSEDDPDFDWRAARNEEKR
jgi:hypothetical protein